MRLLRQNALFLVILVATGCGDPSGPRSPVGRYVLESVNGQDLPFSLSLLPVFAEEFSITSGTLTLDGNGNAVLVEGRRQPFNQTTDEVFFTTTYQYQVDGNALTIDNCAGDSDCFDFEGEINRSTIDLTIGVICRPDCIPLIFNYRRD